MLTSTAPIILHFILYNIEVIYKGGVDILLYYNFLSFINLLFILFFLITLIKSNTVSRLCKNIITINLILNIVQLGISIYINYAILDTLYSQFYNIMIITQISLTVFFLVILQKIFSLKRAYLHSFEESEHQSNLLETSLAKIGAILNSQLNLPDTLNTIADMVADMLHANQSIVTIYNSKENQLSIAATYGINVPPIAFPMNTSLSKKAIHEYRTIYINDTGNCPDLFTPKLLFSKVRSIIAAPLVHTGNIIGTIEVYSRTINAFNEKDAAFLSVLAHHAGAAINAAKLYEDTRQELLNEKYLSAITHSTSFTFDTNTIIDECTHHVSNALSADIAIGCLSTDIEYIFTVMSTVNITNKLTMIDLNPFPTLKSLINKLQPFNSLNEVLPPLQSVLNLTLKINYLMILPLAVNKRLLGIILVGWYNFRANSHRKEYTFIKMMTNQIAIGLEKAHFYKQIKAMALSDGLTKLANRRNFDMFLKTELRRAESLNKPLSLIMLDLDKFKQYNDTFGHINGDQLLQQVGTILKHNVRSIDLPARYGGEEFSIILPEGNISEAITTAELLRKEIETYKFTNQDGDFTKHITASFGIATYDPNITMNAPSSDTIIAIADKALYQAKQEGRNRVISSNIFQ